ncbi:MAG: tRNA (guanosine(46)-N7)-methyltransferase TrmB [Legionellaceae bacterium]|nr:tRNA (guanosine(46)-N7)-methyltransferase TrmB [Legionellaceae bacterium]
MQRTIKSFVLRAGRVSPRQQQGLEHWLTNYILPLSDDEWHFSTLFGREADTIVEIGFGMGASLLTMAELNSETNFIGIEVHRAGIGSLAADIHDHGINNIKIAPYDAVEVFKRCIPDHSLAGIQIFFPDPWPKKRHHKRRLIQSNFIRLLVSKLKPGGFIHCATDWQDYAEHIRDVLSAESELSNLQVDGSFIPRPDTRPLTKFEQRGMRLGHGVWDLKFVRKLA